MEVRQLQTFCILAKELNFTRTAERVHTVQSNVTSQIKSLEAEVGAPLFDRLGKRVVLTEAGRRLRPYAERALAAMDQGHRAVKFGTEPAGPLHIGTPESVLAYRLPEVLKLFRRRYPKVNLFFQPDSQERLADALETGKLDLAISMSRRFGGPQLSAIRMRTEDIYLFSTPDHPLSKGKKVYPKDLTNQTLLLTETGCGYRMMLEMQLASEQVRPESITEFSSIEAIKQCVAAGMGIGFAGNCHCQRTQEEANRRAELARRQDEYRDIHRLAQRSMGVTGYASIPGCSDSKAATGGNADTGAGTC
jgi:DNA-binding transcriptional LysR family regulator